jgi:hypothetical protein
MCGPSMNQLLKPYLDGEKRWERFLSWLATDDELLDFALFLERHFVAHLTSRVAVKLMVVLDKRVDLEANREFARRDAEMNRLMVSGMNLGQFAAMSGQLDAVLKEGIAKRQKWLRNPELLYRILVPLLENRKLVDLGSFLTPEDLEKMQKWRGEDQLDAHVMRVCREWPRHIGKGGFNYSGVDLAPSLEYNLFQALLVTCYGLSQ